MEWIDNEADMLSEHIDGLYSYALALSRNRVDAEDLVQENLCSCYPRCRRMRKESDVKSWMFAIMRNIWLNQLRQRADIDQILPARGSSAKDPTHCY